MNNFFSDDTGPAYPKFGVTVSKYRKLPRTPENISAHYAALMDQLGNLQRSEIKRATVEPSRACPCASGTWHSDGKKILAAVNAQNLTSLHSSMAASWKKRTDAQVEIAYAAAMRGEDAPLTYII